MKKYQLIVLDKENKVQYCHEEDAISAVCRALVVGVVSTTFNSAEVAPTSLESSLSDLIAKLNSIKDKLIDGEFKSRIIERNCTTF